MKGTPLVSVILPVYNVELYLAECLDSVLNQSYSNFELIAVNDGATDGSANILSDYQEKFGAKLIVLEQINQGLSAARNTGLGAIKGEFVYFLDSDDWILPNTLEKCVDALCKNNTDLVVFNAKAFCDDMPEELMLRLDYTRNLNNDLYGSGHQLFEDSRRDGTYIVQSCCYMYRFKTYPQLRFIAGILHEDHYFTTMLFLTANTVSVLKDRFFQRRIRKNSITTVSLTIKHALGYYETAAALANELRNKVIYSNEISKYLNYLVEAGVKIEREVKGGYLGLSRTIALIYRFKGFLKYGTIIRVFFPLTYKKIQRLSKNK